jgi:hypothetical protein
MGLGLGLGLDASLSGGMSAVEKLKVIKREGWGK